MFGCLFIRAHESLSDGTNGNEEREGEKIFPCALLWYGGNKSIAFIAFRIAARSSSLTPGSVCVFGNSVEKYFPIIECVRCCFFFFESCVEGCIAFRYISRFVQLVVHHHQRTLNGMRMVGGSG